MENGTPKLASVTPKESDRPRFKHVVKGKIRCPTILWMNGKDRWEKTPKKSTWLLSFDQLHG